MADYAQNNALVLNESGVSHDLVFDNPEKCSELYFLMTSTGGQSDVEVTANYDDGTASSTSVFSPDNWYNYYPSGDEAVYGISRIPTTTIPGFFTEDVPDNNYKFRLYEYTLPTDRNKKVKSVSFKTDSYSWPTILAISKTGYNVATDITSTVKNVFEKEIQAIYTINGIKLNAPQKGINIIRYTDGTAKKVIIR